MTTIALKDWILAVDGRATSRQLLIQSAAKIVTSKEYVFALAGDTLLVEVLRRFLDDGADPARRPTVTYVGDGKPTMRALVVRFGRPPRVVFYDEEFLVCDLNQDAYHAIGSGEALAMGAMAHGASAVAAVRAACAHDPHSGPPIYWLNCITRKKGVARG